MTTVGQGVRMLNLPEVLLCGPIGGCTYEEANYWRTEASVKLARHNVVGVSPLRAEPAPKDGQKYDAAFGVNTMDVHKAVYSKNKMDIDRADMVLFYLPKEINDRRPSYGSVWELGYAHGKGKPTVLVSDDLRILGHPDLYCSASWVVNTLEDGIKVCTDMLGSN
jgi:nucleoside 2-deoxyribosyltransferase